MFLQYNKTGFLFFSKDAKLGKKCTLLDLSRRPSVAAPEAQGAAVSSGEEKDQDSSSLSKPATDHPMTNELESNERMEEEKKQGAEEKEKSEELPADETPTKMEVDPPDSRPEEQSMTVRLCVIACVVLNLNGS